MPNMNVCGHPICIVHCSLKHLDLSHLPASASQVAGITPAQLHLTFWDRVSQWARSSPIQLGWTAPGICNPSIGFQMCGTQSNFVMCLLRIQKWVFVFTVNKPPLHPHHLLSSPLPTVSALDGIHSWESSWLLQHSRSDEVNLENKCDMGSGMTTLRWNSTSTINYEWKLWGSCPRPVVSGEQSYMPLSNGLQKAGRQNLPGGSGVCGICIPSILLFWLILIERCFLKMFSRSC